MTLGERLFMYRNKVNMSQEKLAEEIGVTRQTISKWETDQSMPDFDKIEPLCEVFGITPDELIRGEKNTSEAKEIQNNYNEKRNKKKAIVLSISIFLYCIATFALPYMIDVLRYDDAHAVMIWATLCTIATVIIVYFFVAYPDNAKNDIKEDVEEINNVIEEINKLDNNGVKIKTVGTRDKIETLVIQIIAILVLLVYLSVSFLTGAWHITWILWIVFIFVRLIVKLIFSMKGEKRK